MAKYIDADRLRAEIENLIEKYSSIKANGVLQEGYKGGRLIGYKDALHKLDSLQQDQPEEADEHPIVTKEMNLMIHTIIAECCDWLAMRTNLSRDEIEGCRNLMLTVKEEQEESYVMSKTGKSATTTK